VILWSYKAKIAFANCPLMKKTCVMMIKMKKKMVSREEEFEFIWGGVAFAAHSTLHYTMV
jgi:hypothetical protein